MLGTFLLLIFTYPKVARFVESRVWKHWAGKNAMKKTTEFKVSAVFWYDWFHKLYLHNSEQCNGTDYRSAESIDFAPMAKVQPLSSGVWSLLRKISHVLTWPENKLIFAVFEK